MTDNIKSTFLNSLDFRVGIRIPLNRVDQSIVPRHLQKRSQNTKPNSLSLPVTQPREVGKSVSLTKTVTLRARMETFLVRIRKGKNLQ